MRNDTVDGAEEVAHDNYYVSQYLEELWVGHLISCTRSGFFSTRLCLTKGAPVEWFRTDLAKIRFVVGAYLS